ncbi:hypothetical protein D3C75_1224890 [compost metagenome]
MVDCFLPSFSSLTTLPIGSPLTGSFRLSGGVTGVGVDIGVPELEVGVVSLPPWLPPEPPDPPPGVPLDDPLFVTTTSTIIVISL